MRTVAVSALLLMMAAASPAADWKLVWADEFNGASGSPPDPKNWVLETGGHGWGNNELQYYTDRAGNARINDAGQLVITAKKESYKGKDYTSARLKTQGLHAFRFGKIEARLQMAEGKGVWPAFWMLGESIASEGWPACGEIDIMELLGHETGTMHHTLHGPGYSGGNPLHSSWTAPPFTFTRSFHVFTLIWEPERITWYVDGKETARRTAAELAGKTWVFDQPFFILMNLAVGGSWPGNPDGSTKFPQQYLIDYVRVYQDAGLKVDEASLGARRKALAEAALKEKAARAYAGPKTHSLPATIQAEDFMPGGEGKTYHDLEPANQGHEYRLDDGVDIQACNDEGGGMNLGWTKAGEWLDYDIDAGKGGTFDLELRAACEQQGGKLQFEAGGKSVAGPILVPSTGSWQNWVVLTRKGIKLGPGRQRLRLTFLSEGPGEAVGNLNWFRLSPAK